MFKEVVSILEAKNFKKQKITPRKREERKRELTQNVIFLLGHVTQIYHQNLLQEEKAMAYLTGRGLTEEFIRAHKLGFANGNLGVMLSMLPEDVFRDLAVEAGLIYINTRGGRRWEFMKGRIAFPDIDRDGRVLGVIGRSLDQNQNPKYLTLNGLPKVIWGLHRFSQWQPLIIHESIMDACTAQLMGVPSCSPLIIPLVFVIARRPKVDAAISLSEMYEFRPAGIAKRSHSWTYLRACIIRFRKLR